MRTTSSEYIKNKILENYIEYQYFFVEFQSKFLSSLYSRYQGLENANLVLYFSKHTHQEILRQKDYNLNFNLSFERFWDNHRRINPQRISLTKIAEDTSLPKETTRRKILQLIKQNVLNKKNQNIGLLPSEHYKKNYNLIIAKEIDDVSKLLNIICKKINLSIPREEIVKKIKKNFSFYWFHYLGTQLEYLRLWSKQINDLELILIFLQAAHLYASKVKEKKLSHKDFYENPNTIKEFISASISATSVAEVTGIPRATCVRKLQILIDLRIIFQDKISKRYYINPLAASKDLISRKITENVVKVFSNFYFICIRELSSKTSD